MTRDNFCEAGTVDYSGHDPRIIKCGRPATKQGPLNSYLCDECYPVVMESYRQSAQRLAELRAEKTKR
jgi:hypothetical protein